MQRLLLALIPLTLLSFGCVERTLTINSNPPGALVYLNGQEVGRTPMTREFTWYGNYDVILRKEGYETLKTSAEIKAPFWQWIPLDLVAELMPHLHDRQQLAFNLHPAATQPSDTKEIIERAEGFRADLKKGQ